MKILVHCPQGHVSHCEEADLGKRACCPREGCGAEFVLESTAGQARGARSPVEAPQPAVPPTEPPLLAVPVNDPVHRALGRLRGASGGWLRGVIVLVLSVIVIMALGLVRLDAVAIGLLAAVVLLHDLGQLGAMKIFGYRNPRLLLLPLFSGAAAGRNAAGAGWRRVIVSLAGPISGLAVGYAIFLAYFYVDAAYLVTAAVLFIALNAIQLLPLGALDGGRFLNGVLFSRHRHIETAVKGSAAVALIGLGVLRGNLVIGACGGFMLVATVLAARIGTIAGEFRAEGAAAGIPGDMPPGTIDGIIDAVRERLRINDATAVAGAVNAVWERICARPPGMAATIGLLLLYLGSAASVAIVPRAFIGMAVSGTLPSPSSGDLAVYIAMWRDEAKWQETVHFAVMERDVEALRRFLDGGGDVETSVGDGDTLLITSAVSGCLDCVRLLVERGAVVDRPDDYGGTALTAAATVGHADVVGYLIDRGAQVDRRGQSGYTPLLRAAWLGNDASVEVLLRAGADARKRGPDGKTALDYAKGRDEDDPEKPAIMARLIAASRPPRP